MKRNSLSSLLAAIACTGLVLPPTAFAETAAPPQQPVLAEPVFRTSDVALHQGGLLVGQVINEQGLAQPGINVSIRQANHEVVRTATDNNGVFAAQGLRGGQYQLVTERGQSLCRFWAAETAPPSAVPMASIVDGQDVVRAQFGYPGNSYVGDWVEWMKCHPYLTAGAVAAAIAIPIALSDSFSSGS